MSEKKFNTIDELIGNVQRGGEVEFIYNNKKYSITHSENDNKKQIYVMEQCNYDTLVTYDSAKGIGEYNIESKKLKEIIAQAEITFRCF